MTQPFAWLELPAVQRLINCYQNAGHELRFVGGCVRDSILERPVGDLDACSPCPPDKAMEFLTEQGIKVIATGIEHGTITAVIDGKPFEITTLRKDIETDGRHATVTFTDSYEEDAARRDFTMNALYCDSAGNITDFYNGVEDAKAGRVKFIGEASDRIQEDALRILRLFRFYATHGRVEIDSDALKACQSHAEMLQQLSGERVQHEMLKLLAAPAPTAALEALEKTHIDSYIYNDKQYINGLRALLESEKVLHKEPDAILRLVALIPDEEALEWTADRWKLSKRDHKKMRDLFAHKKNGLEDIKRSIFETDNAQTIDRALAAASGDRLSQTQLEENKQTLLHWEAHDFPITGDMLKAQGISEGPAMGEALSKLTEKWIASDYALSSEELLSSL